MGTLVERIASEVAQQERESESLTREIVNRYEQLAILFEMSERLGQAQDPQSRMQAILATALESVSASGGCLMLNEGHHPASFLKIDSKGERKELTNLAHQVIRDGQVKVDEHHSLALPLAVSNGKVVGSLALGPKEAGTYRSGDVKVLTTLAAYAALLLESDRLYQDLETLFFGTIKSMVEAIDAKDPRTRGHSERVRRYSLLIADGLPMEGLEKKRLGLAAMLHDVGKIGLPDTILNNRGDLKPEQWALVKQHPQMGVAILTPVSQLDDILPAIGEHHERFDGRGYPQGKAGQDISRFARIISVADAFDAMTMERTYRPTYTKEQALRELRENTGSQFDPQIVNLFLKHF